MRLGGGDTDDDAWHTHARGVWGHAPPRKFSNVGALRLLLEPYLYPNATSPTKYMVGVIPLFATIHISHHEVFQSL